MKIVVNPLYNDLQGWLERLPDSFNHDGETIYTGRNLIKVMTTPLGRLVNVKRYHAPRGVNSLVYSMGMRKPKGQRAFEYPAILKAKGIETPEAIAYIEQRRYGLLRECFLITEQCPYEHTMYEMGNAPEGSYEALAEAFALYTAHMHDRQVMHRDYSPGNILWTDAGDDYHFSIVDINRMYFGPVSMQQGCQDLCRLWGPKRFFLMVVRHYARIRGFDVVEAERIALSKRAAFWKRFGRKHTIKFKLEL